MIAVRVPPNLPIDSYYNQGYIVTWLSGGWCGCGGWGIELLRAHLRTVVSLDHVYSLREKCVPFHYHAFV